MELTHDFVVPASIEDAWSTFMDLEQVGSCFPGATVDSVTDDGFTGTVKVKLGPIALVYTGSGRFIERDDAAHRAVIEAKGKDKRGNGTAGATVGVHLSPAEGGASTRVDVTTDLAITGKPAQFGRGVMQDVSDKLLQQFVQCIEGRFADAGAAPASDGPDALAHGVPLSVYRQEVADEEGMALSPAEVAADQGIAAAAGPQGTPAPAPAAAPSIPAASRASTAGQDDAIDLGATVLPVLLKSYAPYLIAGFIGLVLGWKLGRRLPG